ncbi:MAG TPA: xylulokinase [Clostridiales bacterium]|nr:xylulokinase [Clostridiales bacterium]HPV02313.1 xylulokinase [Clostridiales bacterium]
MKYLLAHDLGTSGNKATLYTVEGQLVKSIVYPYTTYYFNGNWAEQDADDWWKAVCQTTKEILKGIDSDDVAVVSFSGQMMGCLCVDRDGKPLRRSIIWADQRAVREMNEVKEKIGADRFYKITGHPISVSYSLQKLMWIKNNEPEIYSNTYKILNAKDYIIYKLTGRYVTDYSDGSGTNMVDLEKLEWSDEIITTMGIDGDKLPELRESTYVAGNVTREAADATGLSQDTLVVCGGGDGVCAAIGAGCIKPGVTYNVIGSSSWISLTTENPIYDSRMRTFNWAHIVPGYFLPCGSMQAAGVSYSWLKNVICTGEAAEAEKLGISPYQLMDGEAEKTPAGARGLIFLPYLLGERSPWWNPNARGAFIGLTAAHRREDMIRAVLEGITLNLNVILDVFRQHADIKEVIAIGGGARGKFWRQIMADVYGLKILKPNYLEEATSMGAAITGGVGVGIYKNFDVIDRFIRIEEEHLPTEENHRIYQELMPVFEESYNSLVSIYEKLSALG